MGWPLNGSKVRSAESAGRGADPALAPRRAIQRDHVRHGPVEIALRVLGDVEQIVAVGGDTEQPLAATDRGRPGTLPVGDPASLE